MLRQLTIIDGQGKKRSIGLSPEQITFVEETGPKRCNIVVKIRDLEYIYICPKSFKDMIKFTNLSQFGHMFIEN